MRRAVLAILGTIAGLVGLLSFKTHTGSVATTSATISSTGSSKSAPTPTSSASGSSGAGGDSPNVPSSSPSATAKSTSKTVTGDAVDTQYGPVQVKITVVNGKITSATAVDYPQNDPRDEQINSYAIPLLQQESLGRSDAKIDMVSGATYTSDGYIQSLQSALDKA